jgi:hypothetical protein
MKPQIIRYKLHKKLGPVKIPTQKTTFPNTFLPLIHLVLANPTRGNCIICIAIKYPLSFLKIHHITSSCTQALRRNVTSVAVWRDSLKVLMEEWYTWRRRKLWTGRFQSRANSSQEVEFHQAE